MPELPDITVYVECLRPRVVGAVVAAVRVRSPFVVRSADPPIDAVVGRRVEAVDRLGKRIVLALDSDLFIVLHLMIAGRLSWKPPGARAAGRIDLVALDLGPPSGGDSGGVLVMTEASSTKRASLHVVAGRPGLAAHQRGGLDVATANAAAFGVAIRSRNSTLKRLLTDPALFDGIGNSYSDEILHAARLSPVRMGPSLSDDEAAGLLAAARSTLNSWTDRLRAEFGLDRGVGGRFPGPGEITAFRPGFAAHGRFGQPCPACGTAIQRIVYTDRETNYCPRCQTGGAVLADRALSRLLKADWPRRVEDWEDAGSA